MQANLSLTRAVEAAQHLADAVPPWDALLDSTRQFLGGDSATFIVFDPAGALMVTRQHGVAPDAEREYLQHFHAHDIMTARTLAAPQGTWFDSANLSGQDLQIGDRDYLDYMHRHRMRQMLGLIAIRTPQLQGGFTIQRSHLQANAADWSERSDVRRFSAAVQRGLTRLSQKRQDWITHSQGTLEGFGEALCILNPQARILHTSPTAAALLGQGHGWCARRGFMWHSDERTRQHLAIALRATIHGNGPRSLLLRDTSGSLWAHANLAPAPTWTGMGGQAPVLMRLRPAPVHDATQFQQRLIAAFDLTPAESRVLEGLVNGQTLAEHASQHGTSVNTVRAQAAALRQKMDCARQVDLVRKALVLRD